MAQNFLKHILHSFSPNLGFGTGKGAGPVEAETGGEPREGMGCPVMSEPNKACTCCKASMGTWTVAVAGLVEVVVLLVNVDVVVGSGAGSGAGGCDCEVEVI